MPGIRTQTLFDSDGDNTNQVVKSNPGRIYNVEVSNINNADAFLQLFDALTANVTVGTTAPKLSFLVPKGNTVDYGAMEKQFGDSPLEFGVGIIYACTTTATGNGDPTTGLIVNIVYI